LLATAALLVLTVVVGLFAAGARGPDTGVRRPFLPARPEREIAEDTAVSKSVLDVPVAPLPAGHASVSIWSNHLHPEISRTWPETKGSSIFRVDRGTVEIRAANETTSSGTASSSCSRLATATPCATSVRARRR
jgi:hypothetical protein